MSGRDDIASLADRLATTPHERLGDADVERVSAFVDNVEAAIADDEVGTAADRLATFWTAFLGAALDAEADATSTDLSERALQADVVGMDLYQALHRFFHARAEGETPAGWTERLLELTEAHEQHLLDHH